MKIQVRDLKIKTMLIYNPTNEPFCVTGLNELKRDNGTIDKVSGLFNNGDSFIVNLDKCSLSTDMSLMY